MIATFRMAGGVMRGNPSREGAFEKLPDGLAAVFLEEPGPGSREPRAPDPGLPRVRHCDPPVFGPAEPPAGILIEDEDRLVAELRELGSPARSAADGLVPEDLPDHVDFLPRVDLVPDRLEHLPDPGGVRVGPVHQPGDVGETDVPVAELLAAQHPDAPGPRDVASLEGEMDLLDSETLGLDAELVLGPVGAAAVQNTLFLFPHRPLPAVSRPGRLPTIARPGAGTLLNAGGGHSPTLGGTLLNILLEIGMSPE